jgi:hypothetical protein
MSAESGKILRCNPASWRRSDCRNSTIGIKTGFAALDAVLPDGGWPVGALTEVLSKASDIDELRLVAPALAQLGRNSRWQAWIAPPYVPYAPALVEAGINLSRTFFARPNQGTDPLWVIERTLRAGVCDAVLSWPETNDFRALRRLQLAAEQGGCWGVMFRAAHFASDPSPAALRLRLHTLDDGFEIHILNARGGCRYPSVRLTF